MKRLLLLSLLAVQFSITAKGQLYFTENKGQWDHQVLFRTNAGNSTFFLSKDGYTINIQHPDDYRQIAEYYHGHSIDSSHGNVPYRRGLPSQVRNHAFRVKLIGANFNTRIIKEKKMIGYENYFIGDDPSKWASEVHSYQAVTYKNVYPNIDIRYYVQNDRLKYDIVVYPGADLSKVQLKYEGASSMEVRNRELVINTSVGEARELEPYSYQFINGKREIVTCRYKLTGNTLSFDAKGYDKATTLIIDPSMVFSTFSGSTGDNWGFTATPGPDGSFFGAGIVSQTGFPVSAGAYQGSGGGGGGSGPPPDIGIIKLSPNGQSRIYATYLGGNGFEQPHSLICDPSGNLVIAGRTNSSNFPGNFIGTQSGGYDIFVAKLNANGTALIGSVRTGGSGNDGVNITPNRDNGPRTLLRNYGDDGRSEVILDRNNNILVASSTQSANFYTTGAFQNTFGGTQDGVVIKINPNCNTIVWSTYLGGSTDDAAFVLTENPVTGDIYVGGGTTSSDFPGTAAGVLQPAYNGGETDGFIANIRDNGTSVSMIRSSFLGTPGIDIVYGVQFDTKGFPYVMGTTTGNWPIQNAVYSVSGGKQFIAKLQPNLTAFVYSTTFGTANAVAPNISPTAFLVDNCENVYVSGWGGDANRFASPSYPTAGTFGLPVTNDAFQKLTDGSDFYFFVLQRNAASELYGSFFGQRGGDGGLEHVDGGTSRFDADGVIYQALCANCKNVASGLPLSSSYFTTAGSWSPTNRGTTGGACNLGMLKIKFDLSGVRVSLKAVGSKQVNFCLPATVEFVDTLRLAKEYIWVWGDGTQTGPTTQNPLQHTYTTSGFFDVKVIGIDPNSCNERDSAFMRIHVTTDSVALQFTSQRKPPCTSLAFDFTNTTQRLTAIPPFTNKSFVWSWGDGTGNDTIQGFAPNPVSHTFPGPGSYNVQLKLIDSNFCNVGDVFGVANFQVASTIRAGFRVDNGCLPYTLAVADTSVGASTYLWVSSDGQQSTNTLPPFTYSTPGTYTIKQYIFNPSSCNLVDSAQRTFSVYARPTAGFFYSPNPSQENTPTRFSNTASPDVVKWDWDFGDGTKSTLKDPVHQYAAAAINNVCQVVTNSNGCADTLCMPVESLINVVNDLPSAFTPNGDGVNDIFRIRGFGITKMTLRVYNRQGLMVFESHDVSIGWDGKYKGVNQPMDSYAWTLEVEYFTGEKLRKKGDVTLIR